MQPSADRYFHVTRVENRASIEAFGLDWDRMGSVPGIAGSRRPELDAVFLCEEFSVDFFCRMSETPLDVWSVDVDGLKLEDGPDGWWMVRSPIERERLQLARPDVPGRSWFDVTPDDEGGIIGWTN